MKGTKFLSSKAILGIMTAVAVVVTVAGSFAAWDTLSSNKAATAVTVREPAVVTIQDSISFTPTGNSITKFADFNIDPSFTQDVKFTTQFPDSTYTPKFEISVSGAYTGSTGIQDSDFDIEVTSSEVNLTTPDIKGPTLAAGNNNTWTTTDALAYNTYNKKNLTYNVKITPKADSISKFDGSSQSTFTITGKFVSNGSAADTAE